MALGERIGDVSTGLSEEVILKVMKQHKHTSSAAGSHQDMEPCCVCQVRHEITLTPRSFMRLLGPVYLSLMAVCLQQIHFFTVVDVVKPKQE